MDNIQSITYIDTEDNTNRFTLTVSEAHIDCVRPGGHIQYHVNDLEAGEAATVIVTPDGEFYSNLGWIIEVEYKVAKV